MSNERRARVYIDRELHRALRRKSAATGQTISDLVNAAVRQTLADETEDVALFRTRSKEPTLDFEAVLKQFQRR